MSYYTSPLGTDARFTLNDRDGKQLAKLNGEVKSPYPLQLKHPPKGFDPGYPAYEIVVVNGSTEIIEHRKMEPKFYVTDDAAVWKELLAR